MKKPFFSVPRTLILHALTTFLIGVGCVWPLSLSLGLTAPLEECVVCCGAVTLLFALLDCLPRLRALAYPLLLAGISGVAFAMRGQFAAVGAALARWFTVSRSRLRLIRRKLRSCLRSYLRASARRFPEATRLFSRWRCWKSRCCSSFLFSARRSAPRRCCR